MGEPDRTLYATAAPGNDLASSKCAFVMVILLAIKIVMTHSPVV